jgi:glycerol-3-phosphate O-acyltransferase
VLIDRLFHDPKVQEAAEQESRDNDIPRSVMLARVDRYAREIVPSFNAYLYFRLGYWLAKGTAKLLYRVRLGYADTQALAAVNPRSSIVFVMNHRSNMDYVLVAFLAAERVALSYAVGEWARIWPLQSLIPSMGAYFVRRRSGDPLYRIVLQRYVQMATEAGVPQAVYPEGGLTTDGRLRPPKLGLLDYMLKAFDPDGERDLVFIPVGINYDRVLENRTLLMKLNSAAAQQSTFNAMAKTAAFVANNLWLMVTSRWYRFGYACVNFGQPISMRAYVRDYGLDFRRHHRCEAPPGSRAGRGSTHGGDRGHHPGAAGVTGDVRLPAQPGDAVIRDRVEELGIPGHRAARAARRARLRAAGRSRLRGQRGTAHAAAAPGDRGTRGLISRESREQRAARLLRSYH